MANAAAAMVKARLVDRMFPVSPLMSELEERPVGGLSMMQMHYRDFAELISEALLSFQSVLFKRFDRESQAVGF